MSAPSEDTVPPAVTDDTETPERVQGEVPDENGNDDGGEGRQTRGDESTSPMLVVNTERLEILTKMRTSAAVVEELGFVPTVDEWAETLAKSAVDAAIYDLMVRTVMLVDTDPTTGEMTREAMEFYANRGDGDGYHQSEHVDDVQGVVDRLVNLGLFSPEESGRPQSGNGGTSP